MFHRDIISRWDEEVSDSTPLLIPIIQDGNLVYNFPLIGETRQFCLEQLAQLPKSYQLLAEAPVFPVKLSPQLEKASS